MDQPRQRGGKPQGPDSGAFRGLTVDNPPKL